MQRVLVTGATGTLGSALVAALIEARYTVTANFLRDEARAERLAQKTGCTLQRADVRDEREVEKLFTDRFEAVFHLAAMNHDTLFPRISKDDWRQNLELNVQGAFLITRASLRTLPRGGHLVLVSSRVAERGSAGQSSYGAGKAAVLALMKSAALEGAHLDIRVNAICPGFAPSALSEHISPQVLARRNRENWLPDADTSASFAATSVWLLQTRLTGQILRPDCRI